jgi:hypothetical protein
MQDLANPQRLAEQESDQLAPGELPEPGTQRWTATRKAQVVLAIQGGLLTFAEACGRYGLTAEELACWEQSFSWGGKHGLAVARIKQHRKAVYGAGQG